VRLRSDNSKGVSVSGFHGINSKEPLGDVGSPRVDAF